MGKIFLALVAVVVLFALAVPAVGADTGGQDDDDRVVSQEELNALWLEYIGAYRVAHYNFEAAYNEAVDEYVAAVRFLLTAVSSHNQNQDTSLLLDKVIDLYDVVLYAYERLVYGPDPELVEAYQAPKKAYTDAAAVFYDWSWYQG